MNDMIARAFLVILDICHLVFFGFCAYVLYQHFFGSGITFLPHRSTADVLLFLGALFVGYLVIVGFVATVASINKRLESIESLLANRRGV